MTELELLKLQMDAYMGGRKDGIKSLLEALVETKVDVIRLSDLKVICETVFGVEVNEND